VPLPFLLKADGNGLQSVPETASLAEGQRVAVLLVLQVHGLIEAQLRQA
jgi:hypothetical protein